MQVKPIFLFTLLCIKVQYNQLFSSKLLSFKIIISYKNKKKDYISYKADCKVEMREFI